MAELVRPFVGARVRPAFEAVINSIWGVDSNQLSALYAASYVAAAGNRSNPGSFFRLTSTAGGAQERRFLGGSQLVAQRVAQSLGRRVLLKTPVSDSVIGSEPGSVAGIAPDGSVTVR